MIEQNTLKSVIRYNKRNGTFTWKKTGKRAGWLDKSNGYIKIEVFQRNYYAHRLAWLYCFGTFPKGEIDHKNHKRNDNRISNLKSVSRIENGRNVALSANNKSGVSGVYWHKASRKFMARVGMQYIGLFNSIKEAEKVVRKFRLENGYSRTHGRAYISGLDRKTEKI